MTRRWYTAVLSCQVVAEFSAGTVLEQALKRFGPVWVFGIPLTLLQVVLGCPLPVIGLVFERSVNWSSRKLGALGLMFERCVGAVVVCLLHHELLS